MHRRPLLFREPNRSPTKLNKSRDRYTGLSPGLSTWLILSGDSSKTCSFLYDGKVSPVIIQRTTRPASMSFRRTCFDSVNERLNIVSRMMLSRIMHTYVVLYFVPSTGSYHGHWTRRDHQPRGNRMHSCCLELSQADDGSLNFQQLREIVRHRLGISEVSNASNE